MIGASDRISNMAIVNMQKLDTRLYVVCQVGVESDSRT